MKMTLSSTGGINRGRPDAADLRAAADFAARLVSSEDR